MECNSSDYCSHFGSKNELCNKKCLVQLCCKGRDSHWLRCLTWTGNSYKAARCSVPHGTNCVVESAGRKSAAAVHSQIAGE